MFPFSVACQVTTSWLQSTVSSRQKHVNMKKSELKQHKKALLAKKEALIQSIGGSVLTSLPGTDGHGDFADQSAAANEEEISMKLKQVDAKLLRAIEEALVRIENRTYGICIECREENLNLCDTCPEIASARLRAVPWTKVCVAVKEQQAKS